MKLLFENWRKFVNEGKNKKGKEQGVDGKACWDGYRHAGSEDTDGDGKVDKDKCVKAEGNMDDKPYRSDEEAKKELQNNMYEGLDEDLLQELENDVAEAVTCTEFLQRESIEEKKTPAWQRKAGKNKKGGLNQNGRDSYTKATGGNLKAPVSKKTADKNPKGKAAGRRKGFCSRMCGMKKKKTGAKKKRDPDSRINKALRKWDCRC